MIHSLRLKVRAFWTVMSGALSGDSGSAKENQMNEPSSRAATTSFSDGNIQVESGVTKTNREKKVTVTKNEDADSEYKPVSVFKLFRYATALDWFLILLATLMAAAHGAALPGAMLIFGDITNLFANFDISRRAFENLTSTLQSTFQNFTFVEGTGLILPSAITTLTIDEGIVATEDSLFTLLFTLSNQTMSSLLMNASCVVFAYADQLNTTGFDVLNRTVEGSLVIPVFAEGCLCADQLFLGFSSEARCLTGDVFIHGEVTGDGILWQIYYFLMITVAVFIVGYFQVTFMQLACERQVQKIRILFYKSVLRQEIGWFDINPGGELTSRLNEDIDKIHEGIGDKFAILIQWIATFIFGFVIGFTRSWQLSLLMLGLTPIMGGSAAIFARVAAAFTSQEQKAYARAGAIADEVLSAVKTVVAFGGEEKELNRYQKLLTKAQQLGTKKGLSVGASLFIVYTLIFICYAAAFWFGAFLIQEEVLTLGNMLTVFFAVLVGAFALGQAANNVESLVTAQGSAGAVYSIIDRMSQIDPSSKDGIAPDIMDPTIEFKDVIFNYPARPDVQILHGLDLKISVGQTVALVGPSGSGKSTVIQLLQRFYDATAGQVLVSGHNVSELSLKWLRSNIGVVSQEPVLFDATIAENIRYGRQDATTADAEKAAKEANIHNFISQLPNGYDTKLGDRGTQLSGGQKQRIAIARALVRNPKILLLDEATSALDTESEKTVQEALDKAREGRTTIVIAHRLSTIQTADVIVAIDGGRAVEMGTHSQLMEEKGLYYDLVTAQSSGEVEGEFAIRNPLEQARVRRSHSLRHAGSPRRTNRARPRSNTVRSRISSQAALRRFSEFGFNPGVGGGPRQSFHESTVDFVSEGNEVVVRRKSSVRKSHSPSKEYSQRKESIELEVTEAWNIQLESNLDKEIPEVPIREVLSYNTKEWWLILLGILGAFVMGSTYPVFSIMFGEALEALIQPSSEVLNAIHPWAAGFIAVGITAGIAQFIKNVCFSVSGERLTTRLRGLTLKAILRQEIGWFDLDSNSTGILTVRLSQDASRVQGATGSRLGTLAEAVFGLFSSVVVALVYSWLLTIVLLVTVPIIAIAGFLRLKALTSHASGLKEALEQSSKVVVDSIDNIRTVASLQLEDNFFGMYANYLVKPYRRNLGNASLFGVTYGFSQCVLFLGYIATFGFAAFQIMQDSSSILFIDFKDVFIVFTAVVFGSLFAGQAGAFAPDYAKAKQSADRIFSILNREPEIDGYSEEGYKPENLVPAIALYNVQFSYPARSEVQVLKGLNLSVKPNQTLALVGASGSGKSTVVALTERFYNPSAGTITLNDVDLKALNIRWLRSKIGIVSQEPVLFNCSIADNIRYGANYRDVSDEEIVEAAKAANIHTFIDTLPQGYQTNVGAKGTQMSGGQKQRIAIARALVRDPKILLLDEATSALDTESEKIVQEALDKAREGRTTIVIAHRLSTVKTADSIAVLHKGRVAEKGNHSELIEKKGIYYRLNHLQERDTE